MGEHAARRSGDNVTGRLPRAGPGGKNPAARTADRSGRGLAQALEIVRGAPVLNHEGIGARVGGRPPHDPVPYCPEADVHIAAP